MPLKKGKKKRRKKQRRRKQTNSKPKKQKKTKQNKTKQHIVHSKSKNTRNSNKLPRKNGILDTLEFEKQSNSFLRQALSRDDNSAANGNPADPLSIVKYKSNAVWSHFPYKYRSGGGCRSFLLEPELAQVLWSRDSPLSKYPDLYNKAQKHIKYGSNMSVESLDELNSSFANISLYDFKDWYKLYIEYILKKNDKYYDQFIALYWFLESAQFGDVIYLTPFPNSCGTYIIGFGDTCYDAIFNHYVNYKHKSNINIDRYLKLILVPSLFKPGYCSEKFNCIPIEFCDAPINYFCDIPMNMTGFQFRMIDPNRINLNSYNQNIMFKHLNNEILDIDNNIKITIKMSAWHHFDDEDDDDDDDDYDNYNDTDADNSDNDPAWIPEDINIISEKENNNFPQGNEFCWIKRGVSNENLDFSGLGIESWTKRYDEAVTARQAFFKTSFLKQYGCSLSDKLIDILVSYLI